MSDGLSIHHVNVMVDDLTAADAFYTEVLGLERAPTPELGFPAQFYRVGDFQQIHVNQLADDARHRSAVRQHLGPRPAPHLQTVRRQGG